MLKAKQVKQETVSDVKQEIPKPVIIKENIEEQHSNLSSNSHNQHNSKNIVNNKSEFKPHNYGNTDFSKYHNQSKDVLYIAKRLQQVSSF